MQNIQNTNELVEVFTFTRAYFPIKYRLAGYNYKDLDYFTNLTIKNPVVSDPLIRIVPTENNYFEKPFPNEFISDVLLGNWGIVPLKTYYGITVTNRFATPNGAGTGISVDSRTLSIMRAWLLRRYGGDVPNFDMPLSMVVADLMRDANDNYQYPIASPQIGILNKIYKSSKNLEQFALRTKAEPIRVKSIKFSNVGNNSRAQYEENMIYFQTAGATEIKQTIKPSIGRSAKDKNTEVLTITPTKEMILDGLRDLDVNVIGDEIFLATFLEERQRAIGRIQDFLIGRLPLFLFSNTVILPFTPAPALNLENGVTLTVIFEKVRPDFTFRPQKRLITKPTFVPTLAPAITPVVMQEQIKLNAFDETESTEIAPKNNIFAIVAIVLILLVGVVIVGES